MIHSRPGFASRRSDAAPAKLNADMIPAINRNAPKESSPLVQTLQAKADEAHAKMVIEAQLLAAKGGDVLVNPSPSVAPHINEPGK